MEKKETERAVYDVQVVNVTSASRIAERAEYLGINPQEVYVTLRFKIENSEKEYEVSNKLKFLKKEGYNKLLNAKESGELVKISISKSDYEGKDSYFFYLENDVTVDDLFAVPVSTNASKREALLELF